jgi:hypothetical protein
MPQVHNQKDEAKVYLVGVSPEQCKKLVLHQVTVNRKVLQSNIASGESYTKKEIQKKNYLMLIVKSCNAAYPESTPSPKISSKLWEPRIL